MGHDQVHPERVSPKESLGLRAELDPCDLYALRRFYVSHNVSGAFLAVLPSVAPAA